MQFPDSLVSLGESAFGFCVSLQKAILPFTLTKIGNGAFSRCYVLERIALPGNITSVPYSIFSNTKLLEHTDILEGTIVVQNSLLSKISKGTLVLPKTLQLIRESNLTTGFDVIYCYATTPPTVLSDNALSSECKVYVPDASVDAYKAANVWSQGQILPLSDVQ